MAVNLVRFPCRSDRDAGQARRRRSRPKPARSRGLPDGKPDFRASGPRALLACRRRRRSSVDRFQIRAGKSIIVDPPGGKIPYQQWALDKEKDMMEHHMYEDPEAHCTLSGVPRQMYAPFGFQIFQPPATW